MSKKILSLVLAVVMLFSVCAVASNAAVAEGKSIGLRFESDATVGAPAGTLVNVKVYYTVPDGEEVLLQNGPIAVAWNSAAYAPNTTSTNNTISDCRVWGASYVGIMKTTAAVTKAPSASIITNHYNNATDSYGWDSACQVTETMDTSAGYTTGTGYPVDPDCELFTITFVAQRTLTADDVIGAPVGAYGTTNFKINERIEGSTTPSLFSADVVDFSTAVATPAEAPAEPLVYSIGGKNGEVGVKKANDDGATYNIGTFFAFKATDIAPSFNANGTSENITGITATVVANTSSGGSASIDAETIKYVYDVSAAKDKSELGFIVAINNIPNDNKVPNSEDTVVSYTITPTVTTNSGDFVGETITVVVADL